MAAALDVVLERGVDAVAAGLATASPPATVYAVGLWGTGDEALDPGVSCIGLERDREAVLREHTPYEAFNRVWNVSDYAWDARPVPDLRFDPEFPMVEEEAREAPRARGVWDPPRYVLNRIARRLGERPPPWPVTHDFVVFCFDEGFGDELLENLRFSASAEAAATDGARAPASRRPGAAGVSLAACPLKRENGDDPRCSAAGLDTPIRVTPRHKHDVKLRCTTTSRPSSSA